ncbi:hypothetical protein IWX46DRAFT_321400 [Phyllosticta citricarpa]|uniref:Secreted protein n=1 Tax=Phyllosticta citricarpa TaxID=55181 RepID=A0ABR1LGD8_9PEZI
MGGFRLAGLAACLQIMARYPTYRYPPCRPATTAAYVGNSPSSSLRFHRLHVSSLSLSYRLDSSSDSVQLLDSCRQERSTPPLANCIVAIVSTPSAPVFDRRKSMTHRNRQCSPTFLLRIMSDIAPEHYGLDHSRLRSRSLLAAGHVPLETYGTRYVQ